MDPEIRASSARIRFNIIVSREGLLDLSNTKIFRFFFFFNRIF